MTSSASSVNDALAGYAAGRVTAEQLVGVVAAAYYGEGGGGKREGLKPIMDVIEKAHPGVVELSAAADRPGFAVRLAERPFPQRYEGELRKAVAAVGIDASQVGIDASQPLSNMPRPGLFTRIVRAIRRAFGA